MEEDLINKTSIQFPTITDTSDNDSLVFGNMTPMIEIPTGIVLRELEEGESVWIHISMLIQIQYWSCMYTLYLLEVMEYSQNHFVGAKM